MKNPLTIIFDFFINILAVGLQWITIAAMFPFNLLYKSWIGIVRFTGRCLIGIGNVLDLIYKAIVTILEVVNTVFVVCIALVIFLLIIPGLIWLIGGAVFGIGWLLTLAGLFMMAHLIATGIIIVLIIIIITLLVLNF